MDAEAFARKYPGAVVFTHGRKGASVMLAVAPHRLVLKIDGTIQSENVVGLLKDMRAAGHLASDDFNALIDLTAFTGVIDWDEIKKISDVMPKGASRTNKNAYLVHDTFLAMVAKITSALFPQTECAAFTTEKEARAWLGWEC
jgi:hypothetical protein